MQPFTRLTGAAAPLPLPNIDTDVIMPKQFLMGVDRKGLDRGAFFDLRFDKSGAKEPGFILNRPGWTEAKFLVTGPNFGCGSSREHAVWGLSQLGIRALIGSSFAGIFNDNCARNGLLIVTLPVETVTELLETVGEAATNTLTVDLAEQVIHVEQTGQVVSFDIDSFRKDALMRGLDGISLTLQHAADIRTFETRHRTANPWLA
jgi:3-isopropylmalate/(R)-2-methylmalate dehydratase small subunit